MQPTSWSFIQCWNDSLGTAPDRQIVPRNYMWASELGKAKVDRFLAMTGVTPSNPPDVRSRRKFDAGNMWEWTIASVLMRAGILISNPTKQERVTFQYPGLLEVSGRPDFIVGGVPDWEKARQSIDSDFLPESIKYLAKQTITNLQKKYPNGQELKKMIIELKSAGTFTFALRERMRKPDPHHALQAYHYLKSMNMDEARVIYVSKDDCRLLEFTVTINEKMENLYRSDIEEMTNILKSGKRPDLEQEVIFKQEEGRFSDNWNITYSNYLTMLYPQYKHGEEYREKWKSSIASWNRVLGRYVKGDRMTDNNLQAIETAKQHFNNIQEILDYAKANFKPEMIGEDLE